LPRPSITRPLLVLCACGAAAAGGVLGGVLIPAGAQTTGAQSGSSGSSGTASPVCASKGRPFDPNAQARIDALTKLMSGLGVGPDRFGAAMAGLKALLVTDPHSSQLAQTLAQRLGLDTARVQAALDADLPATAFAPLSSPQGPPPAKLQYLRGVANGSQAPCAQSAPPPGANPKVQALQAFAAAVGVSWGRLTAALAVAQSRGVSSIDDPNLAAALASALGIDESRVQSALATLRAHPPFSAGASAARRRP
jgi:2-hydroxychromene-2-carboxylate isomerase